MNKTDWYATLPNGSQIWFAGLDDKERAEKILGMEFVTIYFNECSPDPAREHRNSRSPAWRSRSTRTLPGREPSPLKPRVYYDENPPSKAHWSYKLFIQKVDPETRAALPKPDDYAWFKINPEDNAENIAATTSTR
jgi:phage terminase large subunit